MTCTVFKVIHHLSVSREFGYLFIYLTNLFSGLIGDPKKVENALCSFLILCVCLFVSVVFTFVPDA